MGGRICTNLVVMGLSLLCSACDAKLPVQKSDVKVISLNLRGKIDDKFTCDPERYNSFYDGLKCSGVGNSSTITLVEMKSPYSQVSKNLSDSLPIEYEAAPHYQPYFQAIGGKNYVVVSQKNLGGVPFSAVTPYCVGALERPSSKATMQIIAEDAAKFLTATGKAYNWKLDGEQPGKILFTMAGETAPTYVLEDGCEVNSISHF